MLPIRTGIAAGLLLAGLVGALAALALRGSPGAGLGGPGARGNAGPELAAEVAALRDELRAEREAGRALEREVALLRTRLDDLAAPDAAGGGAGATPGRNAASGPPPGPGPAAPGSGPLFDAARLLASGLAEDEVARLAEVHDRYQLDQLYLRNQAVREGWQQTPRFQHEGRALEQELRTELGELDYDRLLWASGRPNRVAVANVLARSPAEQAGLAPGDVILRYDDRAIFDLHDIVTATTEGELGTQVPVDLSRGGEVLKIYVPRGPLGTHMVPASEPPAAR